MLSAGHIVRCQCCMVQSEAMLRLPNQELGVGDGILTALQLLLICKGISAPGYLLAAQALQRLPATRRRLLDPG